MHHETYETFIIRSMNDLKCSLSDCLILDMESNGIDTSSVFSMVEFLEEKFDLNMAKVEYYMNVLTGKEPDCVLEKAKV